MTEQRDMTQDDERWNRITIELHRLRDAEVHNARLKQENARLEARVRELEAQHECKERESHIAAGLVTVKEANEILTRFNNSHWKNHGEHARYTIPADPKRDDDIRLSAFIRRAELAFEELEAMKRERDLRDTPDHSELRREISIALHACGELTLPKARELLSRAAKALRT